MKKKSSNSPVLKMPEGMRPEAQAYWRAIAKLKGDELTASDLPSLAILVSSLAEFDIAQREIITRGSVVKTPQGMPVKNPFVLVQKDCWDRIRALLPEFGLTPASRRKKTEGAAIDMSDLPD